MPHEPQPGVIHHMHITKDAILIDGEPLPFTVSQEITLHYHGSDGEPDAWYEVHAKVWADDVTLDEDVLLDNDRVQLTEDHYDTPNPHRAARAAWLATFNEEHPNCPCGLPRGHGPAE